MGGILPFGCIFIQLFFILNSIWSHQIYYMFGFLLLGTVLKSLGVHDTRWVTRTVKHAVSRGHASYDLHTF